MKKIISTTLLVLIGVIIISAKMTEGITKTSNKEQEKLPVFESMTLYPEFTIPSITDTATYILHVKERLYLYDKYFNF